MQRPIFKKYKIKEDSFWKEVNARCVEMAGMMNTPPNYELSYMYKLVEEVKLSNSELIELGAEIDLYPGVEEFFKAIKERTSLEIYVVSAGLSQMIKGTRIAKYCDGIVASEFYEKEDSNGEKRIGGVAYCVTADTKPNCIDWLARGSNILGFDYHPPIDLEDYRISFEDMIYIGDGTSDIPAFNLLKRCGGETWGVYNPREPAQLDQLEVIRKDGRLSGLGIADFNLDSTTGNWLFEKACYIDRTIRQAKALEIESSKQTLIKKVPSFVHSWTKRS